MANKDMPDKRDLMVLDTSIIHGTVPLKDIPAFKRLVGSARRSFVLELARSGDPISAMRAYKMAESPKKNHVKIKGREMELYDHYTRLIQLPSIKNALEEVQGALIDANELNLMSKMYSINLDNIVDSMESQRKRLKQQMKERKKLIKTLKGLDVLDERYMDVNLMLSKTDATISSIEKNILASQNTLNNMVHKNDIKGGQSTAIQINIGGDSAIDKSAVITADIIELDD